MGVIYRTDNELTAIYERNADAVYRVCMLFFHGSAADAEDAVQQTFLRLMQSKTRFLDRRHETGWLIVTASNVCKSVLSSGWRKRVDMDEAALLRLRAPANPDPLLASVTALPDKYKTAIYMYYYEGYACREIARFMGKTENSVWGYLHEGRALLRQALKGANQYEG